MAVLHDPFRRWSADKLLGDPAVGLHIKDTTNKVKDKRFKKCQQNAKLSADAGGSRRRKMKSYMQMMKAGGCKKNFSTIDYILTVIVAVQWR